ncbi:MAG: SRPBCC domain-containing protein [archaeon]
MKFDSLKVSETFPVKAKVIYSAWLDGKKHSEFTGSKATASDKVGGEFTAWDEYAKGKNIVLEPYKRIVQEWRTSEFPKKSESSRLEVLFEEKKESTKVTITQTKIPSGQGKNYRQGWIDYYFAPMKKYFK